MARIDSVNNQLVKDLVALQRPRERARTGRFLIEGPHLVQEALAAGSHTLESFYYTADFAAASDGAQILASLARAGVQGMEFGEAAFNKAAETESPQGILAVGRIPQCRLDCLSAGGTMLLLDRVQDPGNMGTILRTAAAAGARGVLLTSDCTDPYSGKVVRSSQGGVFHVPLVTGIDPAQAAAWSREKGMALVCTSPRAGQYHFDADLSGSKLLVLGHETTGVSEQLFQNAEVLVRIPIIGHAESLNVAIAAAVLLYEACRQNMVR